VVFYNAGDIGRDGSGPAFGGRKQGKLALEAECFILSSTTRQSSTQIDLIGEAAFRLQSRDGSHRSTTKARYGGFCFYFYVYCGHLCPFRHPKALVFILNTTGKSAALPGMYDETPCFAQPQPSMMSPCQMKHGLPRQNQSCCMAWYGHHP